MPDQHNRCQLILFESLGTGVEIKSSTQIASGNQNSGLRLETSEGIFFLKLSSSEEKEILIKERLGLEILRKATFLKVPTTYGSGRIDDYNFLLLEFVSGKVKDKDYWRNLGAGIADLHRTSQNLFGLNEDNFISLLKQHNKEQKNWPDFFIQQRLEPLLNKAYVEGLITLEFLRKFQEIYPYLPSLFPEEKPALLHGDLWAGNVITSSSGQPCLIDPAVYFGHREMDIAFSRLFGGFDDEFYTSYHSSFPLAPGFEERMGIYNLYPLLVHLILFGSTYFPAISQIIDRFLDGKFRK